MAWREQSPERGSQVSSWNPGGPASHRESTLDAAESRPAVSVGEREDFVDAPKTSVSSISGAGEESLTSRPHTEHTVENAEQNPNLNTDSTPARPTDDQILAQENSIREAVAESSPFVGDKEPLAALRKEYEDGSAVFLQKISTLEEKYQAIRRTRGDGNCFFRAFIFAYMEDLVQSNSLQERNRVVTCMRQWKPRLIAAGYQELVFEDAQEMIMDQLNSLGTADPVMLPALETNMRDAGVSQMVVMYLRLLTSAELGQRQEFFSPFILGMFDDCPSVDHFRQRYVEPMGEESDHVHIVALTDALQVPIRIVYLDQSLGAAMAGVGHAEGAAVNHHDFVPEALQNATGPNAIPKVHLLYRPGHYDILYPSKSA
ncbi:hypothetical protein WJX73_010822 [Symbiochloris irregularis]|uniref:ubiquitinyl hydrolase 1 n=1 Tax=Symbiochloris irregularis TaxID=706552 RepID=A0AAW1PZZ5_9CHLO